MMPRYRTDWWAHADPLVEVWSEKRAVTSIVEPVASEYGVPYLVNRGFGSFASIHEAAERLAGRRAVVVYCGDQDPRGVAMDRDIANRLAANNVNVELRRVALTLAQVEERNLPPQPFKLSDSRAKDWPHDGSWELDALPYAVLAGAVRDAIREWLPPRLRRPAAGRRSQPGAAEGAGAMRRRNVRHGGQRVF
ncbi:MAG: hypothetical protein OXI71_11595 [Gemmatimonadota bacterium]|nr:hypothetical protein [Gemmatimonadota bacterium]